ncbi:hypothetical protein TCSYLVIO_005897 [Trypanosoma cruzi]|nr:hypothetical protein TCSYLVIO_005897 [Trypanosoma cruzi]
MESPCQPPKETQQLCGVKVAAPRCCLRFTWQDKLHARIVPDASLLECTPTENVEKISARKMAIKYVKKSACFLRRRWRAVPHNPIKVTRRTEWRQLIINGNNCVNAKTARIWVCSRIRGRRWHESMYVYNAFRGTVLSNPAVPRHKRATNEKDRSTLSRKGVTVGQSTPVPSHVASTYVHSAPNTYLPGRRIHDVSFRHSQCVFPPANNQKNNNNNNNGHGAAPLRGSNRSRHEWGQGSYQKYI